MKQQLAQNIHYRRVVMRMLLLVGFFAGLIFAGINLYRELWYLALIELAYAIFSINLWRIILTTPHFQKWTLSFIVPFFIIMMHALSLPTTSETVFLWILTIPIISYLLLGRRQGFWCSFIFISSSILIYIWRLISTGDYSDLNIEVSLNVIFSAYLMISLAHVYERNRELNENRLLELAGTDNLTGLANRMQLNESFNIFKADAQKYNTPLSIALIDLDFFKQINDNHGHSVGDKALLHVASFLQDKLQDNQLLARFGGEEFALLIANMDVKQSTQFVDNLRAELAITNLHILDTELKITFSAGVASYNSDETNLDSILTKADKRLYMAKDKGRNCIVAED